MSVKRALKLFPWESRIWGSSILWLGSHKVKVEWCVRVVCSCWCCVYSCPSTKQQSVVWARQHVVALRKLFYKMEFDSVVSSDCAYRHDIFLYDNKVKDPRFFILILSSPVTEDWRWATQFTIRVYKYSETFISIICSHLHTSLCICCSLDHICIPSFSKNDKLKYCHRAQKEYNDQMHSRYIYSSYLPSLWLVLEHAAILFLQLTNCTDIFRDISCLC